MLAVLRSQGRGRIGPDVRIDRAKLSIIRSEYVYSGLFSGVTSPVCLRSGNCSDFSRDTSCKAYRVKPERKTYRVIVSGEVRPVSGALDVPGCPEDDRTLC